jgi:hypothetical protein
MGGNGLGNRCPVHGICEWYRGPAGDRIDVTPAMDGAYIERWAAEHCLACHVEIESYNAVTARAAL